MRVLVVIPTRYESDRLAALLECLDDADDVLVMDNGHETPVGVDARGLGIYAMWNLGWAYARAAGYDAVAILNDDVRILPGTIGVLRKALAVAPRIGVVYPHWPRPLTDGMPAGFRVTPTAGTVSDGGMTGFAFMFRADLPVAPFDEGFGWWYGDDAFERSVRAAGYVVARVEGLPCEHDSDSEANGWARRPELRDIAEQDRLRWSEMVA